MLQLGARYPSISSEGSASRGQGGLFLQQKVGGLTYCKGMPDQFIKYVIQICVLSYNYSQTCK